MKLVHLNTKWDRGGNPALCGAYVSFTGDEEIPAGEYRTIYDLGAREKWCPKCVERLPMWELARMEL